MPPSRRSELPLGLPPTQFLAYGYLCILAVGFGMLCLPVASTSALSSLDHFFTATSALSTTGLSTLSTGTDYTRFGQLIILLLIQLGGIGYMSLGSFVVLMRKRTLSSSQSRC